MYSELEVLRRTAAEIAAAAVYELYPNVELLGGFATDTGFLYEFVFPHPIHQHLIEEKMRQIVREKRPIRTLEMVPFSASELLRAQGDRDRAESIGMEGLVEVVRIGSFHDLSPGPHLKNTAELHAFKIKLESLGEKRMRLTGWCHRSKEELKQFLKQLDRYIEPYQMGESMGLWKEDVWLAAGLKLKEKLIQFLRKEWFEGAHEISGPPSDDPFELHRKQKQPKVAEIWSGGHRKTHIQVSFFMEMKSCLHLIAKTLTILGFDHALSPAGFTVVDGLERNQVLVRVEKRGNDETIIAYVERILELMLEKNLWVMLENQ